MPLPRNILLTIAAWGLGALVTSGPAGGALFLSPLLPISAGLTPGGQSALEPPAAPPPAADGHRTALNQATFDMVWSTIRNTHWDPNLNGLDWDAVRAELLPKALEARTDDQLRGVLHQMIRLLGQSHFAIIPGDAVTEEVDAATLAEEKPTRGAGGGSASSEHVPGGGAANAAPGTNGPSSDAADTPAAETPASTTKVRVRKSRHHRGLSGASVMLLPAPADDTSGEPAADHPGVWEAVITRVIPESEADQAGLTPGTVVLAVDGRSTTEGLPQGDGLERYERQMIVRARTTGAPNTQATWHVRAPDGTERQVVLRYHEDTRPTATFGNLPPLPISLTSRRLPLAEGSTDEVGYIAFDAWCIPIARPFDQALGTMRDCRGVVLDLRGNPGGIGGMAMGVAGHFTPQQEVLGSMITRDATLNFLTNPRLVNAAGKPTGVYMGPVAILVDTTTASTSEIFAGGLQHLGRARIFGTRTAGAALPAMFDELPNGDVFLHAIADYRLSDGRALEMAGVLPDDPRPYTRLDYAREGDPVLQDALRWIAQQPSSRTADSPSNSTTQEKTP